MKTDAAIKPRGKKPNTGKWAAIICAVIALTLLMAFALYAELDIAEYTVETDKIATPVRLAFVADLHSCKYGDGQAELIEAIREQQPDALLFGGDIFDDLPPHDNALALLYGTAGDYPCFYVTGNHEYWSGEVDALKQAVADCGVAVLEGDCAKLEVKGESLDICGVDDPTKIGAEAMEEQIAGACSQREGESFSVLLTHRPELPEVYSQYDFDLILAGHAHGGQWRIPGIANGLFAPNQGFFPKYAGGRYGLSSGVMIVSRGLARETTKIPRLFNRPELVIIDIV